MLLRIFIIAPYIHIHKPKGLGFMATFCKIKRIFQLFKKNISARRDKTRKSTAQAVGVTYTHYLVDISTCFLYVPCQKDRGMRIIGINGSPRKGWNTHILAGESLPGAAGAGAERINLYDLRFSGGII
jgi:hypothetical protein